MECFDSAVPANFASYNYQFKSLHLLLAFKQTAEKISSKANLSRKDGLIPAKNAWVPSFNLFKPILSLSSFKTYKRGREIFAEV